MTEKRFKAININIWQDGEIWCTAGSQHCADVITTALNTLLEENQHIKQTIKNMLENERTDLGKSILQQLYEAIQ